MPAGRPTEYNSKYCKQLIAHMSGGLSYESFAGVIGTHRSTLYNWEAHFQEFVDAKKEGSEKNLLYWEKAGQEGLWDKTEYNEEGKPTSKKTLNSTVWIFSMKNRHKWKDKQEVEVVKENEHEALKKLSNAELKKLVQEIIEEREEDK